MPPVVAALPGSGLCGADRNRKAGFGIPGLGGEALADPDGQIPCSFWIKADGGVCPAVKANEIRLEFVAEPTFYGRHQNTVPLIHSQGVFSFGLVLWMRLSDPHGQLWSFWA